MRGHWSGARLHGRIYLAVLLSVLTVSLLAGVVWRLTAGSESVASGLETAAWIAGELLPPSSAGKPTIDAVLERWHRQLGLNLALFSADGVPIAAVGVRLPPPPPGQLTSTLLHPHMGAVALLRMPDGRWLAAHRPGAARRIHLGFLWLLALAAVVVAVVAYPLSRRITRRLETLRERVDALGAGDLSARVSFDGHDEVASLAASFNRSAQRIEELVGAQKRLLASASHELRSPLARLRVAAGLLEGDTSVKDEIARDVAELDGLVEELLLASRLEAGAADEPFEGVDLTALAAEECARADTPFTGDLVALDGSPRLLRRLIRNLVENALRHGGSEVEVTLRREQAGRAVLDVADRGPGIPEELRERIFEPFFRAPSALERGGGAGLGLSLARQVARRHGGDIVCLPRAGGGSTFRVTLASF